MSDRLVARDNVTGVFSAAIDPATLGGSYAYVSAVASQTLPSSNAIVNVDTTAIAPGVLNLTLPAAAAGRVYIIRKTNGPATGTITLVRAGLESIDNVAANRVLYGAENPVSSSGFSLPYVAWMVYCDGTNWFTFSTSPQSRLRYGAGTAPVDGTDNNIVGFLPGSFWQEGVGDSGRLYVQTGDDAGDAWWIRIDAVDAQTVTVSTTLVQKDRQLFVNTTGGDVTLTLPDPTIQGLGRHFRITKTNTGTNKITLAPDVAELINGVAANFDLQGSNTAARGQWDVSSDGTNWWVTVTAFTAGGGGGVTDLQGAYDGGPDITLDLTGAIDIIDAATNPDGRVMLITSTTPNVGSGLEITKNPTIANTAGDALNISNGANSAGEGISVNHSGSGRPALLVSAGATTPASRVVGPFGNPNPALEVHHAGVSDALLVTSSGAGVHVDFSTAGSGAALDVDVGFSAPALGLDIDQAGNAGAAQIIVSNAFSGGIATAIEHQGTGIVLDLNAAGGLNVLINARTGGTNVLVVDPALMTVGEPAAPIPVIGHSVVRMGSGTGTTVKGFDAYITNVGSDPLDVNNLGRLLMRPGTNTADGTVADLALRAGSAGETLLTKGGRLYATALLREFVIGTGGVAVQDVVAMDAATSTVVKADPITANNTDNAFGVVIAVEGTGLAGERALVAMGGYVDGLSGLTANTPVYLSDSTAGLLTSTVPTAVGSTSIRIGFAFSQSSIIIHVGEKVAL